MAANTPVARYANGPQGPRAQLLVDHLNGVAERAGGFAAPFGAQTLGHLSGLWHDLGKAAADWQAYIHKAVGLDVTHAPDAHLEAEDSPRRTHGPDHSSAGALHAIEHLGPAGKILAQLIAAHHAGMYNARDLEDRLKKPDQKSRLELARSSQLPAEILTPPTASSAQQFNPAPVQDTTPGAYALWLRMLFSGLIDADRLDSEAFGDEGRAAELRISYPSLGDLKRDFDTHMASFLADTPVRKLRADILSDCRGAALHAPGLFTLTVPTGGGKTLSSLGFALEHAQRHGLKRVIYVIPYTSIIEQTADVFRGISPGFAGSVIEHHSNAEDPDEHHTPRQSERARLAVENWDAPIIVTTSVQFFESLFAVKTGRCRKLHNLCESVVILDEAQLLPPAFLQPIVDALNLLTRHYRTSIVLSTATQPALDSKQGFGSHFRGLDTCKELISDVDRLYRELKRVDVRIPADLQQRTSWVELAERVHHEPADVLVIVNRRAEARDLYRRLRQMEPAGVMHLSALMCGAHRSDVIQEIKQRLSARRSNPALPCLRIISTQLVECGVDLDLPIVYRAFAGLDSIAQAAGRCNREGLLPMGRVEVFIPEKDAPAGTLRLAESTAKEVLHGHTGDALDRALFEPYFTRFYSLQERDRKKIVEMLAVHQASFGVVGLKDAAEAFKLIDNEETGYRSVFVPYRRDQGDETFDKLIGSLRKQGPERWLMRKLQRYSVSLPPHEFDAMRKRGDLDEVQPECWLVRASSQYTEIGLAINLGDLSVASLVG